jgi:hypothetical protein
VLAPNRTVEVDLTIGSNQPQFYPVEPIVVGDTGSGRHSQDVDRAAGLLQFFDVSQFTCWGRSGSTMVLESQGQRALANPFCT